MIDYIINYFNTTKFRFSAIVCIIFILLLLLTKNSQPPTKLDYDYKKNINNISKEEMEQMIVDDLPSPWRLACQMIVRDEDILVEY